MAKIEIDREALHKALLVLAAAIPSKVLFPTDGVYKIDVVADKGACWITAANSKCEIITYAKCEADEDTSFCISHQMLDNTVRNFSDGDMVIQTVLNKKEDTVIHITLKPAGKRKKYKIACEGKPENFPHWPKVTEKVLEEFEYKMGAFSEMIRSLAQNVDAGDPTNYYRDINFTSHEGKLRLITGNSQTAVAMDTDVEFDHDLIVPNEISRYSAQLEEGDCKIKITDGRIYIKNASTRIKAKMIDLKPAGFNNIFATEPEKHILVDREEVLQSLKRMSVFTNKHNKTTMECKDEILIIKASNEFGHEAEEEIEIENVNNIKFSLIMNYAFVMRAMSIMKSDKIFIKQAGASPIVFMKPADKENKQTWMLARYTS